MRKRICFYIVACVLATLVPFLPFTSASKEKIVPFPDWPEQFDGVSLKRLPLSEREERFAQDFSGGIARFTDGESDIIMRWMPHPSRKLQSALDCFKGLGYAVELGPVWVQQNRFYWRSFEATATSEKFLVLERIYDEAGSSWTEVPAWYWATLLGKTDGPWWIVTIIEKQEKR